MTPQPDLIVKKVTVTGAPPTVKQGDPLTIKVVVRNNGLLDAAASTMKFLLVSTGVPRPPKNLKGTVAVPAVPKGTTVKVTVTPIVYDETVPGSYIVSACVDSKKRGRGEPRRATTARPRPGTVTVTGVPLSPADLAVTALTAPPAARLPGETFPVTATVKNHGTGPSPVTTTTFYLVNARVNPRRKNLKGVQLVDPLAAGATNATAATVEVYSDTVPGSYFLQACADGAKELHEVNEGDNCLTSPTGRSPCCRCRTSSMTAIGNPPATIVAGQSFPAATTYTVTNTGAVGALPSTAKFYLVSAAVGATRINLKGRARGPESPALTGPGVQPRGIPQGGRRHAAGHVHGAGMRRLREGRGRERRGRQLQGGGDHRPGDGVARSHRERGEAGGAVGDGRARAAPCRSRSSSGTRGSPMGRPRR